MAQLSGSGVSFGFVLIRVVTGALLAFSGWQLVSQDGGIPNLVRGSDLSSPYFKWWGENIIREYPAVISHVIAWGELLAGLSLLLGGLVRPAGFAIAWILFSCAVADTGDLRHLEVLAGFNALGCALAGAGRSFGMDAMLDQHWPRWITWAQRSDG